MKTLLKCMNMFVNFVNLTILLCICIVGTDAKPAGIRIIAIFGLVLLTVNYLIQTIFTLWEGEQ